MTKEDIKNAALELAGGVGLINITRKQLCDEVGIPDGSFVEVVGTTFNQFIDELSQHYQPDVDVPVTKSRVNAHLRKMNILHVAVNLSKSRGYDKVTRDEIAEACGVSVGLVSRYFFTMEMLRHEVMRVAVRDEIESIIAKGLVNKDEIALGASDELKAKAAAYIVG